MSTTRIEERRRWIEREIRKANQRIVHNAKELREVMDRVLELSQEHANLLLVSALWQSYGDLVTGTPVDTGRAQMDGTFQERLTTGSRRKENTSAR